MISEGAYGYVKFTKNVAVKHSKVDFGADGTINQVNIRESAALRALENHPHIISPTKIVLSPGKLQGKYLVIKMPMGRVVEAHEAHTNCSDNAIADFLGQIASGLAYAHSRNIAHRDIKPANIVYTPGPFDKKVYKIIDWGIAGFMCSEKQSTSRSYVTLCYRSPELLDASAAPADHRAADVWALGVTVLELFFNVWRLQGNSEARFPDAIISARSIARHFDTTRWLAARANSKRLNEYYNGKISPLLEDLFAKIFQLDPEVRITAAEICAHPFIAGYIKLRSGRVVPKKPARIPTFRSPDEGWKKTLFAPDNQKELNARMREILFEWMAEIVAKLPLRNASLFSAFDLVDRVLVVYQHLLRHKFQLLGSACLAIACALYETHPPTLHDFTFAADNSFSKSDLLAMVQHVASCLDWDLFRDTCYSEWIAAPAKSPLIKLVVAASAASKCGQTTSEIIQTALAVTEETCMQKSRWFRKRLHNLDRPSAGSPPADLDADASEPQLHTVIKQL